MYPNYINEAKLRQFIHDALQEDVGSGDYSTLACIAPETQNTARLSVKDHGILAGLDLAKSIFHYLEPEANIRFFKQDGEKAQIGDIAFEVSASVHTILKAERLVLNCMQRMSGIATLTHLMQSKIAHTNAKLLDTRKTTPLFRMLEKWAVLIGGGLNHRYGLFDAIILKDNHVDYAGGIEQALRKTKAYVIAQNLDIPIILETRNLKEVEQALSIGGFDRIMLDNMNLETLQKAVDLVNHSVPTEASGGVNEQTIQGIAETGIDFISVGALTHSAKSLDLSLKAMILKS